MSTIRVTLDDGKATSRPAGTTVSSLAKSLISGDGLPYVAALVNNDVCSLSYPLGVNSQVRFLTAADPHGWRVYRRSLCFLLAKAVRDLYPLANFAVEHSFGTGLYCSFHAPDRRPEQGITAAQLRKIDSCMRELVRLNLPIERRKISYMDAVGEFERSGQVNKFNLLRHRNPPHVVVHWCDGFSDLAHGPLVASTGVLSKFQLLPYKPGFVLHLLTRERPKKLEPFVDQPHLFQIFQEHKRWGKILGVNTVGRLNGIIADGRIRDFIQTAEALHEKKLAQIADQIAAARRKIRLILIAGPSCSGKTTFAKRLATHLAVNGLLPVTISTDDYFVGMDQNPRGKDGKPDFEHLKAVDLPLFNRDLLTLVKGKEIELPRYNFEEKRREYRGEKLQIDGTQPVIIEGIHGLNPALTHRVPESCKFRIYVSALAQISLDSNNRLSTTDNRLMRRIVRDHRYRGHSALDSLQLWQGVRQGEKRWIFPFQGQADATFNSALDYELAVLKPLVEPLLMQIKPSSPEYAEARRLSEFLLNFLPTSDRPVPHNSILREYIGGSSYRY